MLRKALNAFISTDQIDEHLKMTLQEDLNSMAPGIIIQVQIRRHSIKHGRRPTVIRRSEQRPCRPSHGIHPDGLFLARFHVEIYYSCNKSILSVSPLPPWTALVSLLLGFWGIYETQSWFYWLSNAFVPVMKWCSLLIQYICHSSYRPSVSQNHTSQKVFSGTMN